MRVCVIGNSHVAALVSGWAAASPQRGIEFDFYAIPGGHEPKLIAENSRLWPHDPDARLQTTIAGAESEGLDLASFDAVVMSACGLFAARNENIVPDPMAHPLGSVCMADWLEPGAAAWPAGTQFVSTAVFDAVVESYVRRHASMIAVALLAEVFGSRVILQPWPAPSRALHDNGSWFLNVGYGAGGRPAWRDFMRSQYRALERVSTELGSRFTLLRYPVAGPLDDGFMTEDLCDGDPWHANATYGGLVLGQIYDALD
jgi:hypothetical protein